MPPKYTQNDILIRPYIAEDYNDHFSVLMESEILKKYEQDLKKDLADGELPYGSNIENYSVLLKNNMVYCGYVELQKYPNEYSFGIKLSTKYRNMGIGTSAIKSFCDYCYSERNIDRLIIRISPDNHISSHIFKKLGARYLEKKIPPELAEVYEKMGTPITNEMLDLYGAEHYILPLPLPTTQGATP